MRFRIYADGHVEDECNFSDEDCANASSDDYRELEVPNEIVEYIQDEMS